MLPLQAICASGKIKSAQNREIIVICHRSPARASKTLTIPSEPPFSCSVSGWLANAPFCANTDQEGLLINISNDSAACGETFVV